MSRQGRTLSLRLVIRIILLGILLQVALFGYFYYAQRSPAKYWESSLPVAAPGAPTYAYSIYGDWGSPLTKPMDVAVAGRRIYVSDTNNSRIQVFDYSGKPLFGFGEPGNGKGQFNFPYGLDSAPDGRIFVADLHNATISVFTPDGEFLDYFPPGTPEGKTLVKPAGLRIISGRVYVTDVALGKVFVFNLSGDKLLEIGEPGQGPGQLSSPNAVTVAGNRVYVVDTGNHRVTAFDTGGKFLLEFDGMAGSEQSLVVNPRGVGADGRGVLYVVSNLTSRVEGFDREGNALFNFGGPGTAEGQMVLPNGLDIDDQGRIYVTDTVNGRVVVYQN